MYFIPKLLVVCSVSANSEYLHGNLLLALKLWRVFLKDEEDGENTLPYRNSDPVIGTHTEKISLKASDSLDSLYSGQSSSSKAKWSRGKTSHVKSGLN